MLQDPDGLPSSNKIPGEVVQMGGGICRGHTNARVLSHYYSDNYKVMYLPPRRAPDSNYRQKNRKREIIRQAYHDRYFSACNCLTEEGAVKQVKDELITRNGF